MEVGEGLLKESSTSFLPTIGDSNHDYLLSSKKDAFPRGSAFGFDGRSTYSSQSGFSLSSFCSNCRAVCHRCNHKMCSNHGMRATNGSAKQEAGIMAARCGAGHECKKCGHVDFVQVAGERKAEVLIISPSI